MAETTFRINNPDTSPKSTQDSYTDHQAAAQENRFPRIIQDSQHQAAALENRYPRGNQNPQHQEAAPENRYSKSIQNPQQQAGAHESRFPRISHDPHHQMAASHGLQTARQVTESSPSLPRIGQDNTKYQNTLPDYVGLRYSANYGNDYIPEQQPTTPAPVQQDTRPQTVRS